MTDFVSLGTFAVFNVADASISVGTAILVLAVWISERKQNKLAKASRIRLRLQLSYLIRRIIRLNERFLSFQFDAEDRLLG